MSEDKIESSQSKYLHSEKGKQSVKKYRNSDKGKIATDKVNKSIKHRLSTQKWRLSNKGQEAEKARQEKNKKMQIIDKWLTAHPDKTISDYKKENPDG